MYGKIRTVMAHYCPLCPETYHHIPVVMRTNRKNRTPAGLRREREKNTHGKYRPMGKEVKQEVIQEEAETNLALRQTPTVLALTIMTTSETVSNIYNNKCRGFVFVLLTALKPFKIKFECKSD